jgi:hypothetical protein
MANSNGWGDGASNNSIGWGQGAVNNSISWGYSHEVSWAGLTDIVGIDSASSAYFTATGITGATQQTAIDNLVKGLKADGLWSKMKAVYPFVTDNRNLLGYTEQFDNAYWTKSNSSITVNATTAPNGTLTADKINETAINGYHLITSASVTIGTYTSSIIAKKSERNYVMLWNSGVNSGRFFDLENGILGGTLGATPLSSAIEDLGDGWYRCSITNNNATSYSVYTAISSTSAFYLGEVNKGIYIWGAQLELGSTATTYQPIATTQQAFISSQFKYNLVNPVDSDAAFRLVFNGGWTHSSNGATPNGTNGYADTKLVPSSSLSTTSAHFTTYLRTNSTGATCDIGSYLSNARMILYSRYPSSETYATISNSGYPIGVPFPTTDSTGLWQTIRENNTNTKIFQNTIKKADGAIAFSTLPNVPFYIGAINNTSVASLFSNRQTSFSTIGDGLTDTEAANLYTRVQAFQTSLSRQV